MMYVYLVDVYVPSLVTLLCVINVCCDNISNDDVNNDLVLKIIILLANYQPLYILDKKSVPLGKLMKKMFTHRSTNLRIRINSVI